MRFRRPVEPRTIQGESIGRTRIDIISPAWSVLDKLMDISQRYIERIKQVKVKITGLNSYQSVFSRYGNAILVILGPEWNYHL